VRLLRPEHFLLPGQTLAGAEPRVLRAALSADGAVVVVQVVLADVAHLLRFDAATGDRLTGVRALPDPHRGTWAPQVDRTGRYALLRAGTSTPTLVVADLSGATADRPLPVTATAPFVSGDRAFPTEGPAHRHGPVGRRRDRAVPALRGALWSQPSPAARRRAW
jgi:hypothetical protein